MINVLRKENWSDAFLLPLTGLKSDTKFEIRSHLFWNEYTINDYKLILTFSCDNYEEMVNYCRSYVFPVLDKKGYLLENYDVMGRSIFILDMSEWAKDIEMFILGKYSKFSKEAKNIIEKFHTYGSGRGKLSVHIRSTLYPNLPQGILGGKTAIEYVAAEYGLGEHLEEMKKIGEIGSIYKEINETLLTEITEICG